MSQSWPSIFKSKVTLPARSGEENYKLQHAPELSCIMYSEKASAEYLVNRMRT